jgi:hypothetical protein
LISIPIGFILNWAGTGIYPQAWENTLPGNILTCAVSGALFSVLIIISGYLLKITEIREVINHIVRKFFADKSQ